ncbi:MAG: phage portal protein, partial [Lachnospiraceae bacterium]|nr:phage portal protein [Lachnospiraceae bacterium]
RGDYQSRMNGYAVGRQNGWMSANDIRELENLDRIPEELGGDLYLINGNMMPLSMSGAAYQKGKEESDENEEVLELEEGEEPGAGSDRADTGAERHHRRGKLV